MNGFAVKTQGQHQAAPHFFAAMPEDHGYIVRTPMNTCPCIESVKTLITTGKWEGGCCECGKKIPLSHLLIAGVVGLVLTAVLGTLLSRRRS